ncbi:MFS transporter [Allokutzneria oryzae]|uniref:MFS transporter n=1 Tax=Allokutzneria oryzae TaxID=1378989 RepID=A0ABV6A5T2_9PSEU
MLTVPGQRSAVLPVASAATLLVLMNFTAPMTVLGQIAGPLGASATEQTWLLSGISVGLAALLLAAGSLADNHGRRLVFVVGAAGLAASSVLSAVAWDPLAFTVGRVAQGAASAALLATSLGLIGHAFPPGPERARAAGLWGAMLGGGITLGPIVAGALTDLTHWSVVYWLFALSAAVLAVLARLTLPESKSLAPQRLDVLGLITLGPGLAFLVAAVTGTREGWARPGVLVPLALAVVLLGAFVRVESRARAPMLDLALFRRPAFLLAVGGALFIGLAVIGLMSYLPTMVRNATGLSSLAVAGVFSLWSGTSFLASLHAKRLAGRFTDRHQVVASLLVIAVAQVALLGAVDRHDWVRLVVALPVAGVATGLLNATLARLAIGSVPADRSAMGSGANNTVRYLGSALGTAMVVAAGGGNGAILMSAGMALVGAILAVLT